MRDHAVVYSAHSRSDEEIPLLAGAIILPTNGVYHTSASDRCAISSTCFKYFTVRLAVLMSSTAVLLVTMFDMPIPRPILRLIA